MNRKALPSPTLHHDEAPCPYCDAPALLSDLADRGMCEACGQDSDYWPGDSPIWEADEPLLMEA